VTAASRHARAEAVSGHRAGLLSRLFADGIDFAVAIALYFGILMAFAVLHYMLFGNPFRLPEPGQEVTAIAFPIVAAAYLTAMWRATGRSLGKKLFGLRVVKGDGAGMGLWRSGGRAVACVLFGGPSLLWAAVSRRNAAVHDLVFRTAVLHDWPNVVHWAPPEPPAPVEAPAPVAVGAIPEI
jgi:uncharacterized RDD family membrane protein YckC